jgi:hypothetical protein
MSRADIESDVALLTGDHRQRVVAKAARRVRTDQSHEHVARRSAVPQRYTRAVQSTADQRSHKKCSQGISVPSTAPGIVLRWLTGLKGAALRASLTRWRKRHP